MTNADKSQDQSASHPIAVVAARTGLSRDVIRVWERRYGAVAPSRSAGRQRLYTDADIRNRVPMNRFASPEDIAQAIDSIGGQMDAFTAKEYAGYYLKVLDEHLPVALEVLADIVRRPAFSADDLEREKKVVLEEIKVPVLAIAA